MKQIISLVSKVLGLKKTIPAIEKVISDVEEQLAPEVSAPPVAEEKPKKKAAPRKKITVEK